MTYDPIDTNETDSTADGNIEAEGIDVANDLITQELNISGDRLGLPKVASDPASPNVGDLWYRTDLD